MNELQWLQDWYLSQCDGEWEHGYGPKISTIDNPGWSLKMNVNSFKSDPHHVDHKYQDPDNEDNWHHAFIRDDLFQAFGGLSNLGDLIRLFRSAVTGEPFHSS